MDRYGNDAPTLEDGFGTTVAGDQVARMTLEVATPFTLGVTGKWGSGKTSVLRRAYATLKGSPVELEVPLISKPRKDTGGEEWHRWSYTSPGRRVRLGWGSDLEEAAELSLCVWYSPWQHQNASNPLVPLLLEIRNQYTTRLKLLEKAKNFDRRGGLAGLALLEKVLDAAASIAAGRAVKLAAGTSKAVREAWREAAPAEPGLDDGQRFHLLFEDAVETVLDGLPGKNGVGKLIVFVDDLDRCEEAVMVELLESLKLYLGSPRCVFVLGIDLSAVLATLGRHWPGRSEDDNREYLEKLFQAIVPVPLPRPAEVREVLEQQLAAHGFEDSGACAAMVLEILEPNPRKLKNFLNSTCANWALFKASRPEGATPSQRFERRFVLFQYLRTHHSAVWRLLERQPWTLRMLTKVLSRGAEQDHPMPELIDSQDQRMLEKTMFRSFAHVLKEDPREAEEQLDPSRRLEYHDHIPIADAVELFHSRIDRKRSDESFKHHYLELFKPGDDLPDELLYPAQADDRDR